MLAITPMPRLGQLCENRAHERANRGCSRYRAEDPLDQDCKPAAGFTQAELNRHKTIFKKWTPPKLTEKGRTWAAPEPGEPKLGATIEINETQLSLWSQAPPPNSWWALDSHRRPWLTRQPTRGADWAVLHAPREALP